MALLLQASTACRPAPSRPGEARRKQEPKSVHDSVVVGIAVATIHATLHLASVHTAGEKSVFDYCSAICAYMASPHVKATISVTNRVSLLL